MDLKEKRFVFVNFSKGEKLDPVKLGEPGSVAQVANNGAIMEIVCALLGGLPNRSWVHPYYNMIRGRWKGHKIEMMEAGEAAEHYMLTDICFIVKGAYNVGLEKRNVSC